MNENELSWFLGFRLVPELMTPGDIDVELQELEQELVTDVEAYLGKYTRFEEWESGHEITS